MSYIDIAKDVLKVEIEGIQSAMDYVGSDFDGAIDAILKSRGRVIVTGMGKSGIIGKKMAATLASTGTRSFFMHPGEAYHGDLGMIDTQDVVIAISNSGETEELVRLFSFFEQNENTVIAMTTKAESTLAKHSNFFISLGEFKEACPLKLAPTTSTTVTLALGDAMAVALMHAREFKEENFAKFHPGGSLGRKLLGKVKDVMKKDSLPTLSPAASFDQIIDVITSGRMGMGVVLLDDKLDGALGIITDGDVRRVLQKNGADALKMLAKDMATASPMTIESSEKIVIAEDLMREKKISSLLVVSDHDLVGVVHLHDL